MCPLPICFVLTKFPNFTYKSNEIKIIHRAYVNEEFYQMKGLFACQSNVRFRDYKSRVLV